MNKDSLYNEITSKSYSDLENYLKGTIYFLLSNKFEKSIINKISLIKEKIISVF